MWKLIFLAVLIWLIITIAKRLLRSTPASNKSAENTSSDEVSMVQCSTCKVHLPRSEAFLSDGKFYCCETHINKK